MPKTSGNRDRQAMLRAIACARRGLGSTYPNPAVGAAVYSDEGALLGVAHSDSTGGPHAEVKALAQAGIRAQGATLYVTLEPCSHVGRTGRCTDAILAAGVARVVVGLEDPARHASGRGLRLLSEAGVHVDVGLLSNACHAVHEHYLHHVRTGVPFVTLKVACSLDGRTALASGQSRWITGKIARHHVHRIRARHQAIAVGIGTVVADDPGLDVRHVVGESPRIVVFDSTLRLGHSDAKTHRVVREQTIVFHTDAAPRSAADRLQRLGVQPVMVEPSRHGNVSVDAALAWLGRHEIRSLMVEGGAHLLASFIEARRWQRFHIYQAPLLLGGGRPVLAGIGVEDLAGAPRVRVESRGVLGDDSLTTVICDENH